MNESNTHYSVFWFRRDLRLHDNRGLFEALSGTNPVIPLFIFDCEILDKLEDKDDRRVTFIHNAIEDLNASLREMGSSILVRYGKPMEIWPQLLKEYKMTAVYTNEDYEPYARERDTAVAEILQEQGIAFHSFKDSVLMAKGDVLKDDGDPYTVYTPYSKKWKGAANQYTYEYYPSEKKSNFWKSEKLSIPSLKEMGFERSKDQFPSKEVRDSLIRTYHKTRDIPGIEGTSRLGVHLRFGTISIRQLADHARELNDTYLGELIWRDFYHMILWHFPYVAEGPFRKKYSRIDWVNNEEHFEKWKEGKTGYPIVDAGMRELKETGYMHNRVRMIVASFLTKHLLINWQWGEAWFARQLLDFDMAANNGGWQWAAGCGTDAAPYFRVFNPESQMKKFDPDKKYINQWVPEFGTDNYPNPVVDHKEARERALATYKAALNP